MAKKAKIPSTQELLVLIEQRLAKQMADSEERVGRVEKVLEGRISEISRSVSEATTNANVALTWFKNRESPTVYSAPSSDDIKSWLVGMLTPAQLAMADISHVSPEAYAMEYVNCIREGRIGRSQG